MKFLKFIWLYIKLPYIVYKNTYKILYKNDVVSSDEFGYYMHVKEQRMHTQRINNIIREGKPICSTRLLRYDYLNVVATHNDDYDELVENIEQLLSTTIRTYISIEKQKIISNQEKESHEEIQEKNETKDEEILVKETEQE